MKVKSESEVAQSCLTLCDPMDYSLPGSFVHGIFQARVLERGAIAFSRNYAICTYKFVVSMGGGEFMISFRCHLEPLLWDFRLLVDTVMRSDIWGP